MKCKECRNEMRLWQQTKTGENVTKRYVCDACGYEDSEVIGKKKKMEEPLIMEEKKED